MKDERAATARRVAAAGSGTRATSVCGSRCDGGRSSARRPSRARLGPARPRTRRPKGAEGAEAKDATGADAKGGDAKGAEAKQPDVVAPLDDGVRQKMESQFNADFSQVKMHTGDDADRKAEAIGARAFTDGSDIYFRNGEYEPGSAKGLTLLAHELTHVVQQGAAPTKGDGDVKPGAAGGKEAGGKDEKKDGEGAEAKGADDKSDAKDGAEAKAAAAPAEAAPQAKRDDVSQPDDPAELEADQAAAHVASGKRVSVGAAPSAGLHRTPGPPATGAAPMGAPAPPERVEVQIPGMTITVPVDQRDRALQIKGAHQGPLTPALQEIANIVPPEVKAEVLPAVQESREADQDVVAANQELGPEPEPPPEKKAGWRAPDRAPRPREDVRAARGGPPRYHVALPRGGTQRRGDATGRRQRRPERRRARQHQRAAAGAAATNGATRAARSARAAAGAAAAGSAAGRCPAVNLPAGRLRRRRARPRAARSWPARERRASRHARPAPGSRHRRHAIQAEGRLERAPRSFQKRHSAADRAERFPKTTGRRDPQRARRKAAG
jgi:hypothetical protein